MHEADVSTAGKAFVVFQRRAQSGNFGCRCVFNDEHSVRIAHCDDAKLHGIARCQNLTRRRLPACPKRLIQRL